MLELFIDYDRKYSILYVDKACNKTYYVNDTYGEDIDEYTVISRNIETDEIVGFFIEDTYRRLNNHLIDIHKLPIPFDIYNEEIIKLVNEYNGTNKLHIYCEEIE